MPGYQDRLTVISVYMAIGTGGAGFDIIYPIILEIRKKVVFSTPNISRLCE